MIPQIPAVLIADAYAVCGGLSLAISRAGHSDLYDLWLRQQTVASLQKMRATWRWVLNLGHSIDMNPLCG